MEGQVFFSAWSLRALVTCYSLSQCRSRLITFIYRALIAHNSLAFLNLHLTLSPKVMVQKWNRNCAEKISLISWEKFFKQIQVAAFYWISTGPSRLSSPYCLYGLALRCHKMAFLVVCKIWKPARLDILFKNIYISFFLKKSLIFKKQNCGEQCSRQQATLRKAATIFVTQNAQSNRN